MFLKYIAVEIRQIVFRKKRSKTLFKLWSFNPKEPPIKPNPTIPIFID